MFNFLSFTYLAQTTFHCGIDLSTCGGSRWSIARWFVCWGQNIALAAKLWLVNQVDTEDPPKIYFWKRELHSSRLQKLNKKSLGNLSTIIMLSVWTLRIWFATHSLTNRGQTNRWVANLLFGQNGYSKTCRESASWLILTFIVMFIRLIFVTWLHWLITRGELQPFFTQAPVELKMVNWDGLWYLDLPRYCENRTK